PALLQIIRAKSVCAACPVTRECLAFAEVTGQTSGVWGGLSEDDRIDRKNPSSVCDQRRESGKKGWYYG
ncbi:WhiB family transcriptional regulator, partial [Staphylococcus aureus]|uniref:WhiB family transcriptional regulator n=1 Tax=Staphylococcus aureus TaxID=1280 RepID=UPI001E31330F